MPIRHFRKKLKRNEREGSSSESISESEDDDTHRNASQEVMVESEKQQVEESESDQTTDSSEEEEGVRFQRPVFLRSGKRKHPEESIGAVSQGGKAEAKKREARLEKIQRENKISLAREEAEAQVKSNYSTDNDIIKRAMLLDDNDSLDDDGELLEWRKRQHARKQRRREDLVARQMELEEYEGRKLKFSKIDSSLDKSSNSENHKQRISKPDVRFQPKSAAQQGRPTRAQDTQFAELNPQVKDGREESEYFYI